MEQIMVQRRLTDQRTAEALKHNAEGLIEKGFEPSISDLRYIKLAEYEENEPKVQKEIAELRTALQRQTENNAEYE